MPENTNESLAIPIGGETIGLDKYTAPKLKPESYPGEFPLESNVLMIGDKLFTISFDTAGNRFRVATDKGEQDLDDELARLGTPVMAERYPVTVFGSNRCPGQLLDKFKTKEGEPSDPSLLATPMATGILRGYDVVYNSKAGNFGYFFADLYQGPETGETELEVAVLFVTKEQLDRINESEKAYDYTLIGEVEVGKRPGEEQSGIMRLPAYVHIGKAQVYAHQVDNQKQPIALSEVRAHNRQLHAAGQVEFTELFFGHDPDGVKAQAVANIAGRPITESLADAYRMYMKMKRAGGISDLAKRKAFQDALVAATKEEEQMVVDPEQFSGKLRVDWDKHILPKMGEITAIYWAAGQKYK